MVVLFISPHSLMEEALVMAKFKVVISDPETGKSNVVELEDARAVPLIGRKIGEVLDGAVVGLSGHKVMITGGTDNSGFPMRPDIHGGIKTRVLIGGGVGYRPKEKSVRRRKTVRGNTITEDIVQINMKIVEKPSGKGRKAKRKAS
jgi:small subunit ribosomal protein S6e